jgi:hypothetical protein
MITHASAGNCHLGIQGFAIIGSQSPTITASISFLPFLGLPFDPPTSVEFRVFGSDGGNYTPTTRVADHPTTGKIYTAVARPIALQPITFTGGWFITWGPGWSMIDPGGTTIQLNDDPKFSLIENLRKNPCQWGG